MNQRQKLHLPGNLWIESALDNNGRFYIGHARNCSMYFRDRDAMFKFLKLPAGPSRESVKSWLESLADFDQQRKAS